MTEQDLRALFPFLCNHRLTDQSAARLDALSRMLLACNDLACMSACGQGDGFGRRIVRKIDSLYRAMDRTTLSGLLRMYRLTKEVSMGCYGSKDEECSALYCQLMSRYFDRPVPGEELAAMRCTVYEIGAAEKSTELDFYPWFRERCRQWVAAANETGCWSGLPVAAALGRLELLEANDRLFGDRSLEGDILKIYDRYRRGLTVPACASAEQVAELGGWYDLLLRSELFPGDPALSRRIARSLEAFAASARPRTDAWYCALSYAVVQCAADSIGRIQEELLQRIA